MLETFEPRSNDNLATIQYCMYAFDLVDRDMFNTSYIAEAFNNHEFDSESLGQDLCR